MVRSFGDGEAFLLDRYVKWMLERAKWQHGEDPSSLHVPIFAKRLNSSRLRRIRPEAISGLDGRIPRTWKSLCFFRDSGGSLHCTSDVWTEVDNMDINDARMLS